jgi:small subunit ribosomal protein S11
MLPSRGFKGIAHVRATHNNIMITVTDAHGAVLGWSSAGKCGFKGARRATAFAGASAAQDAQEQARQRGLTELDVVCKGGGPAADAALDILRRYGAGSAP